MKLLRNTLLCATMLMGVGITATAFAQEAAPGNDAATNSDASADGNEITVTATRRATSLQDAPINISAVSSEELSRQRIDDVKALAAFTPGLSVTDTGPRATGNIILRGISSSDTDSTGANYNSAVGIYLGEVPLYADFKLIDISRVEVLQGPQGTLYGLGTLAGAVRYIPNRPNTDRWSIDAHLRAFGQSHSGQPGVNGDVTVNIPIVQDHIALRSTVGYYDNPGFIDYNYLLKTPGISDPQPVRGATAADGSFGTPAQREANFYSRKDLNYERTFTTRNQLLLEVNPDLKLYLTYAHQETKSGGRQANGAGVLGTGPYEAPWRYAEPADRSTDLYAAELNVGFGFAQLVATAAITNQKIYTQNDNSDLLIDLNYGYENFPEFSSYNQSTARYKQFNGELRLVSTHGGPFSWVLGGFYNNLRYFNNYAEYTPGYPDYLGIFRPDNLEYISFVNTQTKEKAVYGEGTFKIADAWQVTGGLRYYKFDATVIGGAALPLFDMPYPSTEIPAGKVRSGGTGADGVVWKANTSYKFSSDLMVYATFSTGYRTGNVNRVAPCPFPDSDPAPNNQTVCARSFELLYKPDKTRNAEIGVRASLFDRRFQFTLSAYHIDWKDIQISSATLLGVTGITRNAKDAVSQGIDFTGRLKITPQLTVNGTYSYTDAHLTQDAPQILTSHPANLEGQVLYDLFEGDRLPGSPKNAWSLGATYTHPLGDGRDIEFNWTTTYTGEIYSRVGARANGEVVPGFTTHRAAVTYHGDKFDIGVFADNIFDKYAVTAVYNDLAAKEVVRSGVVSRFYANGVLTPRRVGIDFRFHY